MKRRRSMRPDRPRLHFLPLTDGPEPGAGTGGPPSSSPPAPQPKPKPINYGTPCTLVTHRESPGATPDADRKHTSHGGQWDGR
ncbi:hypothetical protein CEP53_010572 [Fusarium sp. AF-6]|nr:hypothetical protein CEP53_010572 [Fusarium sp. AF-6]